MKGVILNQDKKFMDQATIHIEGSQHLYPVDQGGRFWIYLAPGTYFITISCDGYKHYEQVWLLSCQPRVTSMSCFVYKVIRDL